MNKQKRILLCALFISSCVVLSRFLSVRTPIITVGFSFVPIMLCAIILGPKYSVFVSTISDILGALLFPTGSYFFGFTITSFLTGLTYGLFLHRKVFKLDKEFFIRLIISTLIVTVAYNGILNTLWIIIINNSASKIVVPVRMLKQLVMFPIIIFTITLLCKTLEERLKRLIND